jgi:hypothetical protein
MKSVNLSSRYISLLKQENLAFRVHVTNASNFSNQMRTVVRGLFSAYRVFFGKRFLGPFLRLRIITEPHVRIARSLGLYQLGSSR